MDRINLTKIFMTSTLSLILMASFLLTPAMAADTARNFALQNIDTSKLRARNVSQKQSPKINKFTKRVEPTAPQKFLLTAKLGDVAEAAVAAQSVIPAFALPNNVHNYEVRVQATPNFVQAYLMLGTTLTDGSEVPILDAYHRVIFNKNTLEFYEGLSHFPGISGEVFKPATIHPANLRRIIKHQLTHVDLPIYDEKTEKVSYEIFECKVIHTERTNTGIHVNDSVAALGYVVQVRARLGNGRPYQTQVVVDAHTGKLLENKPRHLHSGAPAYKAEGNGEVWMADPLSVGIPNFMPIPLYHLNEQVDWTSGQYAETITFQFPFQHHDSSRQYNFANLWSTPDFDKLKQMQVSPYYFINHQFGPYLERLGFGENLLSLAGRPNPIHIDVGSTVSFYSPTTNEIDLSSRVTDPESFDPDIVNHEYVHALQDIMHGGIDGPFPSNFVDGSENLAALEGMSDFLATSRQSDRIYAEFPELTLMTGRLGTRYIDTTATRSNWFGIGNKNAQNGLSFSAGLYDLRKRLGTGFVDPVVLETFAIMGPDDDFDEIFDHMVAVDAAKNGTDNLRVFKKVFSLREIYGVGGSQYTWEPAKAMWNTSVDLPMVRPYDDSYTGSETIVVPNNPLDTFVIFDAYTEAHQGELHETNDQDYIVIKDKNGIVVGQYTGEELANKRIIVPGDTINIEINTHNDGYGGSYRVISAGAVDANNLPPSAVLNIADDYAKRVPTKITIDLSNLTDSDSRIVARTVEVDTYATTGIGNVFDHTYEYDGIKPLEIFINKIEGDPTVWQPVTFTLYVTDEHGNVSTTTQVIDLKPYKPAGEPFMGFVAPDTPVLCIINTQTNTCT